MSEKVIERDEASLSTDIAKTKSRIWEIDFLRGICIILMVMDHYFWEMGYFVFRFFGMSSPTDPIAPSWLLALIRDARWYYELDFRIALRYLILFIFFFISGISMNFSKNNIKRGWQILAGGAVITFLTIIGCLIKLTNYPEHFIPFGVLSCYGVSILIVEGVKKLTLKLSKNNINAWIIVSFFIFLVSSYMEVFYLANGTNIQFNLNTVDGTILEIIGCIFGFTRFGADYFPIFPYIGFIALGNVMGLLIYGNKKSLFKKEYKFCKPINYIGSHTMRIYLLHIPVIVILLIVVFLIAGLRISL